MIIIPSKLLQAIIILEVQYPFHPGLQETLSFLTMFWRVLFFLVLYIINSSSS